MSSDGSRASRLIHERAEMLEIGLPSFTTSLLALASFPVEKEPQLYNIVTTPSSILCCPDFPLMLYARKYLCNVPVAMSKRKEKMLPLSSPAHRILPGASNERESTRPVSLLEPPFTFFPVEMFTTCRWCLLLPTWGRPIKDTFHHINWKYFTANHHAVDGIQGRKCVKDV